MLSLQEPFTILILSALFAISIKLSDLVDEHGLKLFPGSKSLLGILWRILSYLLLLTTPDIRSFWFAIFLYWILFM